MQLFRKAGTVAIIGSLVALMCGCVSSSLFDLWQDPYFKEPPLTRMLVIAARKDATKRRIWEDAFTGGLAEHGVAATSSYSVFPDSPPDTGQVINAVQSNGFDGILVVLNLPTDTNTTYVQGYTSIVQDTRFPSPAYRDVRYRYHADNSISQDLRYVTYWQRYRTYYHEIEHPGYADTQTVDIHAIDVTTTGNDGRLIWSATSRTPDPGSVTDVQRGIADLVLSKLSQRGIIGPKK
ncbi:MAG: hypothetical protein JW863_09935 [Chitinispirillaceae bacterium]|nr:hypothetical protein [Chitinispirillaceae bacterium]